MEEEELLPSGCASDQIDNFVENLGDSFQRSLTPRTPLEDESPLMVKRQLSLIEEEKTECKSSFS